MNVLLKIPARLAAYAKFIEVDPEEYAQFVLDDHSQGIADMAWMNRPRRSPQAPEGSTEAAPINFRHSRQ